MRLRLAVAGIVLAGVFAVAGCGGGDGGGGEALTKEEWIAQADEICAEANTQIDALGEPASLEEVADYSAKATEISRAQLEELRALTPPEGDEALIDEALGLVGQLIDEAAKLEDAAKEGDVTRINEIVAAIDPIDERADQLAQDYGLQECGGEDE